MRLTKQEYLNLKKLYLANTEINAKIADSIILGAELSNEDHRELLTISVLVSTYQIMQPKRAYLVHKNFKHRNTFNKNMDTSFQGTRLIVSGQSKKIAFYCGRSKPSVIVDVSNIKL